MFLETTGNLSIPFVIVHWSQPLLPIFSLSQTLEALPSRLMRIYIRITPPPHNATLWPRNDEIAGPIKGWLLPTKILWYKLRPHFLGGIDGVPFRFTYAYTLPRSFNLYLHQFPHKNTLPDMPPHFRSVTPWNHHLLGESSQLVSDWLICPLIMLVHLFPFQMAVSWLINGGDPNHLHPSSKQQPFRTGLLHQKARLKMPRLR